MLSFNKNNVSIPINCMLCHVELSSTQRHLVLPTHTVYQQNSTSAGFILGCSHLQCRMQQILWQFYSVSSMWMILIRSVDPHKTLSYFWLGNGRLHCHWKTLNIKSRHKVYALVLEVLGNPISFFINIFP